MGNILRLLHLVFKEISLLATFLVFPFTFSIYLLCVGNPPSLKQFDQSKIRPGHLQVTNPCNPTHCFEPKTKKWIMNPEVSTRCTSDCTVNQLLEYLYINQLCVWHDWSAILEQHNIACLGHRRWPSMTLLLYFLSTLRIT